MVLRIAKRNFGNLNSLVAMDSTALVIGVPFKAFKIENQISDKGICNKSSR